ncbi:carbon monoxide dehydrogenase, partial [Streptomyces sp. MBT98]|nr:carbon monoxide dehydrogenase [Streptomyces sp. MBT98]
VTESLAGREGGDADGGAEADADGDDAVAAEGLAGDEEGADGADGVDASGDGIRADDADDADDGGGPGGDDPGSLYDSPVPPPSLDPVAGVEFTVPDEPPAEAAHARRTMIGRSAEEVDHAPPRGRYAPVPSPEAGGASTTLRWVAPVAALALASAVVLGRALRRRRP